MTTLTSVGEPIRLRGSGKVIVTDPRGLERAYEAGDGRSVTLKPMTQGEHSFAWENGREGTFSIMAGATPPPTYTASADDLARLAKLTDAEGEPVLTMAELDALLTDAAVGDSYNFNAAAAEGWRVKAARAAKMTSYSVGDMSVNAEQIFTHTMEMVNLYEGAGSTVGGSSRKQLRSLRVSLDYDERIQPTPFR